MKNAIIICLFLFMGCSPATRLARLEKKHPELFKNIQDTLIKIDTFTKYDTSEYEIWIDTFTQFDTITNQTIVQIRSNAERRIMGTRYITKYIKVNNTKYIKEQPKQNWKLWSYIAIIITIFVIIWKILK